MRSRKERDFRFSDSDGNEVLGQLGEGDLSLACRNRHPLHPRLFVNAAHGPVGWGLACGSGKLIASLVSGAPSELPPDTIAALHPERFNA